MMRMLAASYRDSTQVHAVSDKATHRIRAGEYDRIHFRLETLCLRPDAVATSVFLLPSPKDYKTVSMQDGRESYYFAGLDYLPNLKDQDSGTICRICYDRARLVSKLNLESDMFTLLRTQGIPTHRWAEYKDYPVEWVETLLVEKR